MAGNRDILSRLAITALLGGGGLGTAVLWLATPARSRLAPANSRETRARHVAVPDRPNRVDLIESRQSLAHPHTGQTAGESTAKRREIAGVQARRALALANLESDPDRRRERVLAAVEAWASVDPAESVAWSDAQPDGERELALAAAFQGAVKDSAAAAQLARELCLRRPERAGDYGQHLLTALARAAAYAAAADFAASASGELRDAWVQEAYSSWAQHDPAAALAASSAIDDANLRSLALRGLIAGWADVEPSEVMESVLLLPAGPMRDEALSQALPQWVAHDPAAAATWLRSQGAHPTFDGGAAALASRPELTTTQPDIATRWAASIVDPTARANALRSAALEWAHRDPEALERFIEFTPGLRETDRVVLREGLDPAPDA